MDIDRKLEDVAANLDDISETIEEIKDEKWEGDQPKTGLDDLQQHVEQASDAIDEVVDPDKPR